ncbi:hypothetical protein OG352_21045 [Streptomyces sp. NBC_01485]|uniref:tRNA adenosine deaminase-associated protein n=1 Tax=Streptomyces sp. NBC_01485 TaxID=2903884 RepID=UPI002E3295B7|nr:hypothetical protein [Streptomyces sp. NBC_01485]
MYFAALLARTEDGWEASDTELDDVETLSDLADLAREASPDDDTVLVLIEQEDSWFGVVRIDGEEDPRIFVSDAAAAARSSYGEILLTDELLGRDPDADDADLDALDLDGTEDGENDNNEDDDEASAGPEGGGSAEIVPHGPLGDSRILDDLGVGEKELKSLSEDAVTEIAEALGASEVLETVR